MMNTKFNILFAIFFLIIRSLMAIGASQNSMYPQVCKIAANDDQAFSVFRREDRYRDIVETLSYGQGVQFLMEISERYPHLLDSLPKICDEDWVGGPTQHMYPPFGSCSPTILRYLKVAGDLQREFGDLKSFHIVEIGGGYGGQCKMLHDLFGFASYTIIDIPECIPLIRKYLSCFGIENVFLFENNEDFVTNESDLVISNYAFSEIDRMEQSNYIKKVINYSERGYMIYNPMPMINPYSIAEFELILLNLQKRVKIEHEDPSRTGEIVIWRVLEESD